MDGKANLRSLIRPIHPDTTPSSSSPQDFLRSVQAALKRHRPIGVTQSNNILPKRTLVPQREASRSSTSNTSPIADAKKSQGMPLSQERSEKDSLLHKKNTMSVVGVYQEDASITPPSISGTCTNTFGEGCNPFKAQERHPKEMANCEDKNTLPSLQVESQNINALKKVQFAIGSNNTGQDVVHVPSLSICLAIYILLFSFNMQGPMIERPLSWRTYLLIWAHMH
ncbi:hypothetical protein L6164_016149 [Bauhinia variegata]|uniref:Uncharacterized protein n=1 Tax=Bauhinia variegata TaxID=167791 RepID=A0ACB9NQ41_BAUVA|nr:hypothetical protein L6164_016149 [Bauhinia variegata]